MTILAEKVLRTTIEFIGPASQRFLERQTEKHLSGLKFEELEHKHLQELSKWVKISAALLIDPAKAAILSDKIAHL